MTKHILLVEDHNDSREVLANLLRRLGADVVTADTVGRALALLTEPFDAVIADIDLPDGKGHTVVREAKARQSNILGIALTACTTPADIETGKLAGFDHYLTKPFDFGEIRALLGGGPAPSQAVI